ncbi:MAG: hypothetical protein NT031_17940, partial [Planctomycetota bacterium]|nr:hypothetical protein [Planctomycetota bacterium]
MPWSHWTRPLSWWLPIILLMAVAATCLSLIVHEQWSKRENLRYPIASVASSIISGYVPGSDKPLRSDNLFWLGLVVVLAIRTINGLDVWFPGRIVSIPMSLDFTPLAQLWPAMKGVDIWPNPFSVYIYPTVIAFAFFLASDVALTLGLTQFGMAILICTLAQHGISVGGGDTLTGTSVISWQLFGSWLGLGFVILYLGRNYYVNLLRRCFTSPGGDYTVWALRGLGLAGLGLAAIFMRLGIDWPIAFLTVGLLLLVFTVASRISVESGLFHIEANWNALGVLSGLFGLSAMGPKALVAVGLISVMLTSDYRECLMPFVSNALRICDTNRVRPAKVGWTGMGVFALALAVAVPVVLMANYSKGAPATDGWGYDTLPKMPFEFASKAVTTLQNADQLELSKSLSGLERLTHAAPQTRFLWAAGLGLAGVLVFSKLRLRWTWWPLHPILFAVWGTYPVGNFSSSFLLGWERRPAIRGRRPLQQGQAPPDRVHRRRPHRRTGVHGRRRDLLHGQEHPAADLLDLPALTRPLTVENPIVPPRPAIAFVCGAANDLFRAAVDSGLAPTRYDTVAQALDQTADGSALLLLAEGYPDARTPVTPADFARAAEKKLRVYVEFPDYLPGTKLGEVRKTTAERAVVAGEAFAPALQKHRILMITDCRLVEAPAAAPLLVSAWVAGFDTAVFGLPETNVWPILFEVPGTAVMAATTKLSHFVTGRYAPTEAWNALWAKILGYLLPGQPLPPLRWSPTVHPAFGPNAPLPADAAMNAFRAGTDWFVKAPMLRDNAGGVSEQADGRFGVAQCFVSKINLDGSQPLSCDQRNDCNGEVAMALALRSRLDGEASHFAQIAANILDCSFATFQAGARDNPASPSYGLMSWASGGAMDIYFADDNARALLGAIATASALGTDRWDRRIARAILANFRCSGPRAFQGHNLFEPNVQKYGWRHYWDRDEPLYAPHFESWIWACYLWLYARTSFAPLLEKTRAGIAAMMAAYPHEWHWTNGLQQERARMLLPLAWLVRVDDTPEHRAWLYRIADDLLACQDECGAIREELGSVGHGRYGAPASNEKYATAEAPLIQANGDAVADMLYTSNFAMVSLTEAAAAVGDARLGLAADKLAEFMVRIQVSSTAHPELHASWFRAFDYKRWDYWASNADAGWGVWCNETGWTVGWITAMLALRAGKTNFWDFTADSK